MTTKQICIAQLPTPVLDYVSLFGSPDLQQQAETIENAVAGFCRNTVNSLVHQGDELNDFLKSCRDRLGDKNGKAAFKEWLESGKFGQTNYIAKAAMTISDCFSELDDDTKELARKNANTWSVAALKAFAKAAKVSMLLLKALVKRKGLGPVSEKHITNLTNLLKVQQPKQPKLPIGTFVEVVADDKPQLKGQIGVIDDKDEHGNIVVRLFGSGTDTTLKSEDVAKKTPKSANEALLGVIEHLHEESLQKQLKLSEYQSAPVTEDLLQSERDKIAADAITAYKESQAEKEAALYEKLRNAALAEANAKIEASNQIIQRLTQQLENKERLAQEIAELQQQLELQNQEILRSQELKEERQKLEQQVVKLQEKLRQPAANLASDNQEIIKVDSKLDNQQNYRDNSAIIAAPQSHGNTEKLLSQESYLINQQKQEQNEYQGQQR